MTQRSYTIRTIALLTTAILGGCAMQQAGPGAVMPLAPAHRATSAGSLLYVLDKLEGRKILIYAFPGGTPQKPLLLPTDGWAYVCSDSSGHIFAPASGVIFKYAHGGRKPIAYLQDKGALGQECAGDPRTGKLAVINEGTGTGCTFAVYKEAKGQPQLVRDSSFRSCELPTYDSRGDLFFYGNTKKASSLMELPFGTVKFVKISLNKSISSFYGLQWDGQDLAVQTKLPGTEDQPVVIERIHVSGTNGTIVKTIRFNGWKNQAANFWISGDKIVAPINYTELGIWNYPQGGKRTGLIKIPQFESWTVSLWVKR